MKYERKSWWSQRTKLEKILTLVCGLGALVTISLLVSLIVVAVNNGSDSDETSTTKTEPSTTQAPAQETCLTAGCVREAASVLSRMNLEADPCNNFYEFSCGKFMKENVIPDDKVGISTESLLDNKFKENLRIIIEEPILPTEIEAFQNTKRLYKACLDTETIENRGRTPVDEVFRSMGGWPVTLELQEWNENSWTWQQSVALSLANGFLPSYILLFSVSPDYRDTTKRSVQIDQASLGLNREYLINRLDDPVVKAYHDYQVDLAVMFGADRTRAQNEMRDVLDFEFKLADISLSREDRRNYELLYNPRTVAQLQADYPYNNWLEYFNSILPLESQLTETDIVIVGALSFFEKLGEVLSQTPKRVLANYVMWRQAMLTVSLMPKSFQTRNQEYYKTIAGVAVEPARWSTCIESTSRLFHHAFGALYVRKHFKEDSKALALKMIDNIKAEFKIMLTEITWMDEETKREANEKVNLMENQIGYADELLDDAKIQKFYNSWPATVDENEYLESILKINSASTIFSYKQLREPFDKTEWTVFIPPAIIDAFYSPLENAIKFPAGILQGVFFDLDRPQYMNYGAIGFVIGHEITHGFDDQGSQYDASGNLRNWWQKETRDAFTEKAQCIIDQYGNYIEPLTGLNLNGVNTQGENIADNGGVKESYRAYVRWAENNPEGHLPGLNFTPQQMFWISAGQIWCANFRENSLKNQILTGAHSPGQFRVIGPLSNMPQFSEDFKCQKGSKMNPENKCEVW